MNTKDNITEVSADHKKTILLQCSCLATEEYDTGKTPHICRWCDQVLTSEVKTPEEIAETKAKAKAKRKEEREAMMALKDASAAARREIASKRK